MRTISGLGVSGGGAVGPVVLAAPPQPLPDEAPSTDAKADAARIGAALRRVAESLEDQSRTLTGAAAQMLLAASTMARDPGLAAAVDQRLTSHMGPAHALADAVAFFARQLTQLGGNFAERAVDLRDVGERALAVLLDRPVPGVPPLTEPSVVVAEDLAPAETSAMDPAMVLAIVTAAGGRTSHTAILAAQRGIPAIVQAAGVLDLEPGTMVAVDGDSGVLTIDPDDAVVAAQQERRVHRARLADHTGPGRTADGHPVALLANVGGPEDAATAAAADVEGVGLVRTEFVFLSAQSAPTVEEQARVYAEVLAAFAGRPVTVRTLDAGADKPLAFADLGPEPNPALGRRGLRLMAQRTDLLDDQLAALAQAAKESSALVKVMAPMVATALEAEWFAERAHAVGLPVAGVMIEVPAAALRSRHVLEVCDFASLGTNDLAQYTMAGDRTVGELSELLDHWQPAVLDMVAAACAGGATTGKPVGVCGESGGDPLMAVVLTGLGIASLSMAVSRVPMVRYALKLHTLEQCQDMAAAAQEARTAADARAAVAAMAHPDLLDLL